MSSSLSLPPATSSLPEELDFQGLLRSSLSLIQTLAGQDWSNLNASDPGYTILEQLSYALTELGYRAGLPVPTLLASADQHDHSRHQRGLYTAAEIFPGAPVTIADQRRVLLDRLPSIANAWLYPLPLAADQQQTLGPRSSVSGLYHLVVLPASATEINVSNAQTDGLGDGAIRDQVRTCYAGFRSLCEDIDSIIVLQPTVFALQTIRLSVEPDADPDLVLASLLHQLGLTFTRAPSRQSLNQRFSNQASVASLLSGPLPQQGFIPDEQLFDQLQALDISQLRKTLASIAGLIEIDELTFKIGEREGLLSRDQIFPIPANTYLKIVFNLQAQQDDVCLYRSAARTPYSPVRVTRLLSKLWGEHQQTSPTASDAQALFSLPVATGGDLNSYSSLLRHFPAAYQLTGSDSDPGLQPADVAKRRQFKAYLMIFDQFIADALAQIAMMPELFSLAKPTDFMYPSRPLYDIPGCDPALLVKDYDDAQRKLRQRFDAGVVRESAILDFLLSLYGQSQAFVNDATGVLSSTHSATASGVQAKRQLLLDLVPLSRDRAMGIAYCHPDVVDMWTAFEQRCSIQTSALLASPAQDAPREVNDPSMATFGRLLSPSRALETRPCLQPVRAAVGRQAEESSPGHAQLSLATKQIYHELRPNLNKISNYRLAVSAEGNGYELYCLDRQNGLWSLGCFDEISEASWYATRLTKEAIWQAARAKSKIHVIEWILLRFAMDAPAAAKLSPTELNQRVTAVLPDPFPSADPAAQAANQQALQQALRPLLPAHLTLEVLTLNPQTYAHFLEVRRAWLMALAEGQAEAMTTESLRMLRLLRPESLPDPPQPMSDPASSGQKGLGSLLVTWPQNTSAMGLMICQPTGSDPLSMTLLLADPTSDNPPGPSITQPVQVSPTPATPEPSTSPGSPAQPPPSASPEPTSPPGSPAQIPTPVSPPQVAPSLVPEQVATAPAVPPASPSPMAAAPQAMAPPMPPPLGPPSGSASPMGVSTDGQLAVVSTPTVPSASAGSPGVWPAVPEPAATDPARSPEGVSTPSWPTPPAPVSLASVPGPAASVQPGTAQAHASPTDQVRPIPSPPAAGQPLSAPGVSAAQTGPPAPPEQHPAVAEAQPPSAAWQAAAAPAGTMAQASPSQFQPGSFSPEPPVSPLASAPPVPSAASVPVAQPAPPVPVAPPAASVPPVPPAASVPPVPPAASVPPVAPVASAPPAPPVSPAPQAPVAPSDSSVPPQGGPGQPAALQPNPTVPAAPLQPAQAQAPSSAVTSATAQPSPMPDPGTAGPASTAVAGVATLPVGTDPPSPSAPVPSGIAPPTLPVQPPRQFFSQPATVDTLGLRLFAPPSDELLRFCLPNQIQFLLMPLPLVAQQNAPAQFDLTRILAGGIALMFFHPALESAGQLSEEMGVADGMQTREVAKSLGLPPGLTIWLTDPSLDQSNLGIDLSTYATGWARAMTALNYGYDIGLFVSSKTNFSNLLVNRFCQSLTALPEPMLGFSMVRHPLAIPGLQHHCDPTQIFRIVSDRRSSTPSWLLPAQPPLWR